jgi:hypothetical protein
VTRRSLRAPLTDAQLAPLLPQETLVQLSFLPSDAELRRLAAILEPRPDVSLRVYGNYDRSIHDLEFLRLFPFLRRFAVDSLYDRVTTFDALRHLPEELEELGLGGTKRALSLEPVGRFRRLRRLYVEGPHRDLQVISRLTELTDLTLRSVTLRDLAVLLPLGRLRTLDIKLGGTKDLALLPRIGRLEYLELWLVRGLSDVSAVAEMPHLRHLFLQALKHVTTLPSFAGSAALRRVDLETMRGLTDLAPLAGAPSLEILNLIEMRHLQAEAMRPFVGHPSLRAGIWDLGSKRRNFAAQDLVPLPPEPFGYAEARRGEASDRGLAPWRRPEWTGFRSAE